MDVKVKETGKIETLSIIDPKSGADWIGDLVGNTSDVYGWDDKDDCYIMTQEEYDWWVDYTKRHQSAEERFEEIISMKEGAEHERIVTNKGNIDFDMDYYPERLQQFCDDIEADLV